jgi:hypothetical protein
MKSLTDAVTDSPCPYLSQIKPYTQQETFLDYLVNHYALMAMNKGSIDHARHMTKLLKSDFPTLGILIAQKLTELRNEHRSNETSA